MDNRKIILGFYVASSMVLWFLSRSSIHWLVQTFYQIRRLPGIAAARELVPVVLALGLFVYFFRSHRVNSVLDEVVSELRKVTWPTREDVMKSTTVVIICILIASVLLAGFDVVWGKVVNYLLHG